jgi:hypothetical protein
LVIDPSIHLFVVANHSLIDSTRLYLVVDIVPLSRHHFRPLLVTMAAESLYLALGVASGLSVPLILTAHLYQFFTGEPFGINGHHVSAVPLWTAIPLAFLFSYASGQHKMLRAMRTHGCKPGVPYPHRDRILGIDWVTDMVKAVNNHSVLQEFDRLFRELGDTYVASPIGTRLVMTSDPENVKALLATQFESWPIGGVRQSFALLVLGRHAIFSVNGPEWHQARALIRPSFVRNQIADLECTDRHVDNFLARVPRDGSRVDLQKLFYMFTMDVSTDFM